jgi:signal transduction histidine kinase
MYVRVGAYFIIYTLTTMYSTHTSLLGDGRQLLSWIYPFMLVTGTMMSMYSIWPSSIPTNVRETIIQIWWPLSLFYMLILFSGFFVLLSDFSLLQTSVAFLNLLVIVTLYKWQMSVISLPLGLYMANKLYNSVYGSYNLQFDPGSPEAIMLYLMLLCGTAIIMFVKPKQEYLEATEGKVMNLVREVTVLVGASEGYVKKISSLNNAVHNLNNKVGFYTERVEDQAKEIERLGATSQKILNNVTHELRLPVGNVMNFASLLSESLDKLPKEQLKELSDEVLKNSEDYQR